MQTPTAVTVLVATDPPWPVGTRFPAVFAPSARLCRHTTGPINPNDWCSLMDTDADSTKDRPKHDPSPGKFWRVEWDDRLRIAIPAIDAEHHAFVDHVNELNARICAGLPSAELRPVLHALIRDTSTHFEHEQRLFRQWQYPDRDRHTQSHAAILERLDELARTLIDEMPDSERFRIGLTIRDILLDHIRHEDSQYAGFDSGR